MDINAWLKKQQALQEAFGFPIDPKTCKETASLLYAYSVGAIKELSEAMDEFSWKPWASDAFVDREAVLSEVVDTQFFLLNMLLTIGATEEELESAMLKKFNKNTERANNGYTHLYMKCKSCRRALDDFYDTTEIRAKNLLMCPKCLDRK